MIPNEEHQSHLVKLDFLQVYHLNQTLLYQFGNPTNYGQYLKIKKEVCITAGHNQAKQIFIKNVGSELSIS